MMGSFPRLPARTLLVALALGAIATPAHADVIELGDDGAVIVRPNDAVPG